MRPQLFIVKSLLSSPPEADQREGIYPSLAKRGEGIFLNSDTSLIAYRCLSKEEL
jgi:hypothetical protein